MKCRARASVSKHLNLQFIIQVDCYAVLMLIDIVFHMCALRPIIRLLLRSFTLGRGYNCEGKMTDCLLSSGIWLSSFTFILSLNCNFFFVAIPFKVGYEYCVPAWHYEQLCTARLLVFLCSCLFFIVMCLNVSVGCCMSETVAIVITIHLIKLNWTRAKRKHHLIVITKYTADQREEDECGEE